MRVFRFLFLISLFFRFNERASERLCRDVVMVMTKIFILPAAILNGVLRYIQTRVAEALSSLDVFLEFHYIFFLFFFFAGSSHRWRHMRRSTHLTEPIVMYVLSLKELLL